MKRNPLWQTIFKQRVTDVAIEKTGRVFTVLIAEPDQSEVAKCESSSEVEFQSV